MKVRFKKLHPKAVAPIKAHDTDAGFDLTATSRHIDDNGCIVYGTGIAIEIPSGYYGALKARSSVAKYDIMLSSGSSTIDSGYRGEIFMKFRPALGYKKSVASVGMPHDTFKAYEVGDRIGQLIILPIPEVVFEEAEGLSDSDRGDGGYGSSGR